MVYIVVGFLIVVGVAYKLHITSVASLKAAVSAEVVKLEASATKVEPAVKAELSAVLAKLKSLL